MKINPSRKIREVFYCAETPKILHSFSDGLLQRGSTEREYFAYKKQNDGKTLHNSIRKRPKSKIAFRAFYFNFYRIFAQRGAAFTSAVHRTFKKRAVTSFLPLRPNSIYKV